MRAAPLMAGLATAILLLGPALMAAAADPEVPPETAQDQQERSRGDTAEKLDRASGWVKDRLSGFHVTPGRIGLALGLVGFIVTRTRDRKVTRWAILQACSLLLCLGSLGVIFFYEL